MILITHTNLQKNTKIIYILQLSRALFSASALILGIKLTIFPSLDKTDPIT